MTEKAVVCVIFSAVLTYSMWRYGVCGIFRRGCKGVISVIRRKIVSAFGGIERKQLESRFRDEQNLLKKKCVLYDGEEWQLQLKEILKTRNIREGLHATACLPYVLGSDISFIKGNERDACVALVVLKLPELEVVYEDISMVELSVPYIPGFLAFREAEHIVKKVDTLKKLHPEFEPLALMVDGNGTLHDNEFGLACHTGVLLDMVTLGVAKTPYTPNHVDLDEYFKNKFAILKCAGDVIPVSSKNGKVLGVAYKSTACSTKPIFISPGHKITLDTSIDLVRFCCKFRVPEPIRQADIRSRQYLRDHFES